MKNQYKKMEALKYAFPKTLPVMAGYLVLGAAFGILMRVNGFGIFWALLWSVFVYAGSLQYLGITFFTAVVNPWYALFMSVMLNARHLFYGLSMVDRLKDAGRFRPYLIFSMTDETFSVLCSEQVPDHLSRHWVYFFIAALDQLYWVFGTLAGAIAGTMIRFDTAGMDFALTALFTVIFIDQWKSRKDHGPACIGVISSVLCVMLFGKDVFIVPAMVVIISVITIGYWKSKDKEERN
ncbi:AzlC family ABC transporter permease [Lacrimispora sp.]|uniref:AzlC family ABC transporter permease n=1 Tax=Lacrimispora sp. TaxID=2719234 RepID=UPI0032E3D8C5